jgi:hypothetical protein
VTSVCVGVCVCVCVCACERAHGRGRVSLAWIIKRSGCSHLLVKLCYVELHRRAPLFLAEEKG